MADFGWDGTLGLAWLTLLPVDYGGFIALFLAGLCKCL
jgi:hypothetical protein